jgi:hypothetical protein
VGSPVRSPEAASQVGSPVRSRVAEIPDRSRDKQSQFRT